MRRMAVVVVIALIAPSLAGADDKTSRAASETNSGTWVVVGSEANGKKLTKDELPWQCRISATSLR